MSTHSLGHQSSGFGFTTSLSSKPKTHGWLCICNYKPFRLNHNHYLRKKNKKTHFQLGEDELLSSNCAAEDRSATLVKITDELSDPLFNQLIAFRILIFWIIGRYSTASLRVLEQKAVHVNSVTHQVGLGDPQTFISCSFQPFLLHFTPKCPCFYKLKFSISNRKPQTVLHKTKS
ncbi:hypothetical protein H5410_015311 [Solanum commersonii]|uniref:Uncharacterized protein n=1 Tax=Solanum commersonii TaxID=4109 RepID=A0A9J5ZU33_SOLCO|nr:hypothetical protein H5410_015311 [Solanum commersonii]